MVTTPPPRPKPAEAKRGEAGSEFRELIQRIPEIFIKAPPQGKHGKYVGHSDIGQIALLRLRRPHGWRVLREVRGFIPEGKTQSDKVYPERPNGIVGVVGEITVLIDGEWWVVSEEGEANSPSTSWDWENTKTAASDAYKRCWMRLGLGLELWVEQGSDPSKFWLPGMLDPPESEEVDKEQDPPDTGGTETKEQKKEEK